MGEKNYTLIHYVAEHVDDPSVVELVGSLATDVMKLDDNKMRPIDYARNSMHHGSVRVLERLAAKDDGAATAPEAQPSSESLLTGEPEVDQLGLKELRDELKQLRAENLRLADESGVFGRSSGPLGSPLPESKLMKYHSDMKVFGREGVLANLLLSVSAGGAGLTAADAGRAMDQLDALARICKPAQGAHSPTVSSANQSPAKKRSPSPILKPNRVNAATSGSPSRSQSPARQKQRGSSPMRSTSATRARAASPRVQVPSALEVS